MNKTKIEWTRGPNGEPGYTWNPIRGLCPVGCWYCYARKIYKRFGTNENPCLVDRHELVAPMLVTGPNKKRVFVCSTFDLFCEAADPFRDAVFGVIEHAAGGRPDLTFIILTKLPERIDRTMPDNVWLGVSVTKPHELWRWYNIKQKRTARVKFISLEPILEDFRASDIPPDVAWLILGRLTGHGKKNDPARRQLNRLKLHCARECIPLFMKSNLQEIWGGKLVQEWPKEAGEQT